MLHEIKVNVDELLGTLADNLEMHEKEYIQAVIDWRDAQRVVYEEAALLFGSKSHAKELMAFNIEKLPKPQSYAKDYKTAMAMLKWTVDKEIELDSTQFRNFVLDEWTWKESFSTSNSLYSNFRK